MIQRKQTLWLLLSTISSALTFKFPFFTGTTAPDAKWVTGPELTATDNIFLILLSALTLLQALLAIILFKDRKKQLQITLLGLASSIGLVVLYVSYMNSFEPGCHIALTAVLNLFIILGFFFAIRGIRHDQKLIKDLNRLR